MPDNYHFGKQLIMDVQEAGREILSMRVNPIFVKERCSSNRMTDVELCAELIKEAKKLRARGCNVRFVCPALDKKTPILRHYVKREEMGFYDESFM